MHIVEVGGMLGLGICRGKKTKRQKKAVQRTATKLGLERFCPKSTENQAGISYFLGNLLLYQT